MKPIRFVLSLCAASLLSSGLLATNVAPRRPNILIFVADDAGCDLGVYGNHAIRTPSLDRLAATGLRVDRAFLTIPQCSPSRISILSGRYPHATGAEDLHMPLPAGQRLLPSYLQGLGYFTGHMQKTHYGPNGMTQFNWYDRRTSAAFPAFLDAAADQSFFLWVGFSDPHRPYAPGAVTPPHDPATVWIPPYLADTLETRADIALYYDEISRMDGEIGLMLAELDRRGMRENTLVVFLSDNGPPFPREKGTLYDGGIRTPLIFSWAGVVPAGSVHTRGQVSVIDLAPTLLEVAAGRIPGEMQGHSIRDLLSRPDEHAGREYVFSERNWHNTDEHMRSVRTSRFKLIRTDINHELPMGVASDLGASPSFLALRALAKAGRLAPAQSQIFTAPRPRIELYDLAKDPWELNNVADHPDYATEVRKLAAVLQKWMDDTDDFPAWVRTRPEDTDRITGVKFTTKYPPMLNPAIPPPAGCIGERIEEISH